MKHPDVHTTSDRDALPRAVDHWVRYLAGVPASVDLPSDRRRPARQQFEPSTLDVSLSAADVSAIRDLARFAKTTPFVVLTAAWHTLLHRVSRQSTIVTGTHTLAAIQPGTDAEPNLVVLRSDFADGITTNDLLNALGADARHASEHAVASYQDVLDALVLPDDASRAPLVQTILNVSPYRVDRANASSTIGKPTVRRDTPRPVDIAIDLREQDEIIAGTITFDRTLSEPVTVARLFGHLCVLVREMCADPARPVARLHLLSEQERASMLADLPPQGTYPADVVLHTQFERQVARTPNAVALTAFDAHDSRVEVTYAELNERANLVARRLQALGVVTGQRVGLRTERNANLVVGLLAILKAGGAYVPLDPVYPVDRMAFMLEDAGVSVLLTERRLAAAAAGLVHERRDLPLTLLCVDDLAASAAMVATEPAGSRANLPPTSTPEDLAYVIYTSGSTGKPKGVGITHANVARLFTATEHWFGFNGNDVWTLFHSYAFDFSVWELWGALLYGGRLVVVPRDIARSPDAFHHLLQRERVTVLNQTPTAFRQLIDADHRQAQTDLMLRVVVFGGEALELQSLKPWFARYGDQTPRLVNMYGITETTVHVTYRPITIADLEANAGSVIGEPIPDLRVYVLDVNGDLAPIGVPGELCVAGAGVAGGYLNRPELTTQRFVHDPFGSNPAARMYRSGDLARRLTNGDLEYLGRIDQQVKIRGFRIELGEIESVLARHAGVRQVAVIDREDVPGDRRLVAYIVTSEPPAELTDALRAAVRAALPEYMAPAHYLFIETLPCTANGKLDRKALPSPQTAAPTGRRAAVAPRNDTERALWEIWRTLLKVDEFGVEDNFFELGGHSLLAVSVIDRMRTAGLQADARTIFVAPTVAALAAAVADGPVDQKTPPNLIPLGTDVIRPEMLTLVSLSADEIARVVAAVPGGAANIQDIYPLAPLQEGFLFHHMMEKGGDPYLVSTIFGFDTRARLDAHLRALQAVVDRHDILRTAVVWEGLRSPVQVVCRQARLPVEEVTLDAANGDVAAQLHQRYDLKHFRMDVSQAPLLRVFVAYDAKADRWVMLQLFHHLAIDHTTMELIQEEVQAHLEGRGDTLPVPLPFRTFVAKARSGAPAAEHEAFFTKMLGDVDGPTLPFGLGDVQGDGTRILEATDYLDADLARRLRACARMLGVSPASLCHLAFALMVGRISGRDDVVFGTLLFGRIQGGEGAERVLGPFINTLPLRITIGGECVEDAVRRTHARLAELLRHEHAPLATAQRCSGVAAPAPLFGAVLNYRYSGGEDAGQAGTKPIEGVEILQAEFERTNYPLFLSVDDRGDAFSVTAQMQSPIDPHRICEFMHMAVAGVVETLERSPADPIDRIDVLPAGERRTLVDEWNHTASAYDRDALMQHAFEAQVLRTPERVAVRHEGRVYSYRWLASRANRLARALRSRGVGRGQLVGICLDRGVDMLASVLGVLKAGSAYVPLDPAFPEERLRYMAADAGIAQLVSTADLAGRIDMPRPRQLLLDVDAGQIEADLDSSLAADPSQDATPESAAYVIYTSGSTGKPKGVVIPHRAVVNFLASMTKRPGLSADDVLVAVTTLSFDIAVLELQLPLTVGATVVVASREAVNDGHALRALVEQSRATVMQATPVTWRLMLAAGWKPRSAFKALVGGEALPRDLADQLIANNVDLWNMYGPTETTVWSTCERVRATTSGITIGTPIANTTVYVLDAHRKLCPIGVAGEIWIGGDGVALGYRNQPELTADRFVPDPFAASTAMIYKTGDRGRWRADGTLEHHGRLDLQVKIRGYRIELGEIEEALSRHPNVAEAVVMARQDSGEPRLAAYVVARRPFGDIAGELRAHVRTTLPDYMIPVHYVPLESVPLTANGKIDRRALPVPEMSPPAGAGTEMRPRTPTELAVAKIWSDVLGLPNVDVDEAFFELGGDSLTAMQVIARLRQTFDVDVRLRDFFRSPTVAAVAARLDAQRALVGSRAASSAR